MRVKDRTAVEGPGASQSPDHHYAQEVRMGSYRVRVRVQPKAKRAALEVREDAGGPTVRVRVTEPPERGAANIAVEALLASRLGLPSAQVRVVAGHASRDKLVEVPLEAQEVWRRLGATGR